jgi:hypothetical protein
MTPYWTALLAVAAFVPLAAQDVPHVERLLSRRYVEGDRVQYLMKTQNDGSTYEVRITATTKKASDGRFVEEFAWSDMVANSAPRALAATSQDFRLAVTLEGRAPFAQRRQVAGPGRPVEGLARRERHANQHDGRRGVGEQVRRLHTE